MSASALAFWHIGDPENALDAERDVAVAFSEEEESSFVSPTVGFDDSATWDVVDFGH